MFRQYLNKFQSLECHRAVSLLAKLILAPTRFMAASETRATNQKKMFRKLKDQKKQLSSFSTNCFCKEYELTSQVLFSGSRSITYLAKRLATNEDVCVRIVNKEGLKQNSLRRIINEFKVLRSLNHENIVLVYDIYDQNDAIYIVSEYFSGDSLGQRISDESYDFSEAECKYILKTVAGALKYCKDEGVVHRNITPENIIFSNANGKQVIKIVDFQWSKQLDKEEINFSHLETRCGTPMYTAPEIISGSSYSYKSDIWSLGIILYLMLSGGYFPFQCSTSGSMQSSHFILSTILNGEWDFKPEPIWNNVSMNAKGIVKKLLTKKPSNRATYEDILSHPFLSASSVQNNKMLSRAQPAIAKFEEIPC